MLIAATLCAGTEVIVLCPNALGYIVFERFGNGWTRLCDSQESSFPASLDLLYGSGLRPLSERKSRARSNKLASNNSHFYLDLKRATDG